MLVATKRGTERKEFFRIWKEKRRALYHLVFRVDPGNPKFIRKYGHYQTAREGWWIVTHDGYKAYRVEQDTVRFCCVPLSKVPWPYNEIFTNAIDNFEKVHATNVGSVTKWRHGEELGHQPQQIFVTPNRIRWIAEKVQQDLKQTTHQGKGYEFISCLATALRIFDLEHRYAIQFGIAHPGIHVWMMRGTVRSQLHYWLCVETDEMKVAICDPTAHQFDPALSESEYKDGRNSGLLTEEEVRLLYLLARSPHHARAGLAGRAVRNTPTEPRRKRNG